MINSKTPLNSRTRVRFRSSQNSANDIMLRARRRSSLLDRRLQNQCVPDHLPARLDSRDDLLVVGQHRPALNRDALEPVAFEGHIYPIAVMQVEDGGGRDHSPPLLVLTVESSGDKHAKPQDSGVRHFKPDLGGSESGIKTRTDIVNAPAQHHSRVRIEMNLCILANADE